MLSLPRGIRTGYAGATFPGLTESIEGATKGNGEGVKLCCIL